MGETITRSNEDDDDDDDNDDDDNDDDDDDYEWNTNLQHVVTYKQNCYRKEEVFKMIYETLNL
jgi:hypothetical protein